MIEIDFTARVMVGFERLEAFEPGCTDRIDISTLDVYSLSHCPLAQSIGNGSFGVGRIKLGIPFNENETAKYGFSLTYAEEDTDHDGYYRALKETWISVLTEHRNARAV